MIQFVIFLHVLGAVLVGFYLILPFFVARLKSTPAAGQVGLVQSLYGVNRFGMYVLIVQFLTGGYLISQADYQAVWMILSIVLFLLLAAFSGMMSKPLRRMLQSVQQGNSAEAELGKIRTFSTLLCLGLLIIIILMMYPMYR